MCCYEGWDYTGIFACDGMQNSDFFFQNTQVSSGGPCFGGGLYVLYLLKSRLKMEDVNKQRRNFISGKFRKIWVESKWNTTIWVIPGILSGNNGTSDQVVLFFRRECSKRKFLVHFFKLIFDTSFRPSRSFFGKWN